MPEKILAFTTHDGRPVYFGDQYWYISKTEKRKWVSRITVVSAQDIRKGDKQFLTKQEAEKELVINQN